MGPMGHLSGFAHLVETRVAAGLCTGAAALVRHCVCSGKWLPWRRGGGGGSGERWVEELEEVVHAG